MAASEEAPAQQSQLQSRVGLLERQLTEAHSAIEALRAELHAAAERALAEQEAREREHAATLRVRDAELERLRRANKDLSVQLARRGGSADPAVGVASSLASVEGDLALLLERVRVARVAFTGNESSAGFAKSPGGAVAADNRAEGTRSPPRSRAAKTDGNSAQQLPPILDADEAALREASSHSLGGGDGENDTEGDSASVGEEERHGTWTRRANSSAPFDTLSQASLNTDDGRFTYSNSEYTTHLGALSDQDDGTDDGNAAGLAHLSPRSSASVPNTGSVHAPPSLQLDAHPLTVQQQSNRGRVKT